MTWRAAVLSLALACGEVVGAEVVGRDMDRVTVYLHYRKPRERQVVDAVADVLTAFDYRVVDKRLVTQPTTGDVRFFHAADRSAALHVKAVVDNVLAGRGSTETLAVLERVGRFPDARPGLVEVWLPRSR
jgi:hypothetical protein